MLRSGESRRLGSHTDGLREVYEQPATLVRKDRTQMIFGPLDLLKAILAEGESYGYAILKRVRDLSGGELEWTDGMLYPLLHRLSRLGYVTTEWRMPPEGRRRTGGMLRA